MKVVFLHVHLQKFVNKVCQGIDNGYMYILHVSRAKVTCWDAQKHQSISKAMVILRLSYYNIINKCNIVISFTFEGCE